MYQSLSHRRFKVLEEMSPRERDAVLASAHALERAAETGNTQQPLRGKNLALLCEAQDSTDAAMFHRAATELGANVAHIRASLAGLGTPQEVRHTARMLGRLYDAVECQGLSRELVEQLERDAGVPVYDSLARTASATTQRAEWPACDAGAADSRRFLLQALLVASII